MVIGVRVHMGASNKTYTTGTKGPGRMMCGNLYICTILFLFYEKALDSVRVCTTPLCGESLSRAAVLGGSCM